MRQSEKRGWDNVFLVSFRTMIASRMLMLMAFSYRLLCRDALALGQLTSQSPTNLGLSRGFEPSQVLKATELLAASFPPNLYRDLMGTQNSYASSHNGLAMSASHHKTAGCADAPRSDLQPVKPRSFKDVNMSSIDLETHPQEQHHDIIADVSPLSRFLSPTLNYTSLTYSD